ncbi:MAG: YhcH/YjgK/YiaL family protein [Spirochaetales bacterium]
MIYDSFNNLNRYYGLIPDLNKTLKYLATEKDVIKALPEGKHPIDGDRVIIQVMTYDTKDLAQARFEAHRKYIDIQFVLDGKEACYARSLEGLEAAEPFNDEKDVGFFRGEGGAFLPLEPGVFTVFFPWDAHKPSCDWEGKHKVRKVVVKVKV